MMRRFRFARSFTLFAAVATGLLVASGCSKKSADGAAGEPRVFTAVTAAPAAPAWKLTDLDGRPLASADLKGKVVVVDFWATWCGPCLHEIPGYIELQKKYGPDRFTVVGLSLDEIPPAEVKAFATKRGLNYPVAIASPAEVAAFGNFEGIPATFIIDREGKLRFQKIGVAPVEELEALVKTLL